MARARTVVVGCDRRLSGAASSVCERSAGVSQPSVLRGRQVNWQGREASRRPRRPSGLAGWAVVPTRATKSPLGGGTRQDRSLVCLRPSTSGRVDPLPSLRAGRCRPRGVRQGRGQARRRPDRAPRSGSVGEGPARPAPPAWTDTVHGAVPCGRRAAGPPGRRAAGPPAQPRTPGTRYRCRRTVASDGYSSIKVPDAERDRDRPGKPRNRYGRTGYPVLRLMMLVETGNPACPVPRSAPGATARTTTPGDCRTCSARACRRRPTGTPTTEGFRPGSPAPEHFLVRVARGRSRPGGAPR